MPRQSSEETAAQAAAAGAGAGAGAGGISTYDSDRHGIQHTHIDDRSSQRNEHNGKTSWR